MAAFLGDLAFLGFHRRDTRWVSEKFTTGRLETIGTTGYDWKRLETTENDWKQLETTGNNWKRLDTTGNDLKRLEIETT